MSPRARSMPPINALIIHTFEAKPGSVYCVAPCHGRQSEPQHSADAHAAAERIEPGVYTVGATAITTGMRIAARSELFEVVGEPTTVDDTTVTARVREIGGPRDGHQHTARLRRWTSR
jgi:hypothetical protein